MLLPYYVLEETGISSNKTSLSTNIASADVIQYDIDWTNGVGIDATIEVDVLSSYEGTTVESAWKWTTLSLGGTAPTLSGASGSHNIILTSNPFEKIRIRVVYVSGSADVKISIKGNGN
jgi:hypothetical protein